MKNIQINDPELFKILKKEISREESTLELIASENFTSKAVMEMAGSVMTNKYAEGYPGKRYYGGCEFVDKAEELAISRVKELFNWLYKKLMDMPDNFVAMFLSNGILKIFQFFIVKLNDIACIQAYHMVMMLII